MTFFEYVAEQVREILASLGFRIAGRGDRPGRRARHRPAIEHWKARGLDLDPDAGRCRARPVRPGLHAGRGSRTTAWTRRWTTPSSSCARGPCSTARRSRLELPVRNVNRTVGTMLGSLVTRRYGADGLPDGHHRHHLPRVGRAVVRRVPAAGHHDAPGRRRQRLRRQGAVRRGHLRPAATRTAGFVAEQNVIARQRHRLRRDQRRDLPARRGRGAVLRAQLRRHRGRRGHRRPRPGVHDRRRAVILGPTGRNLGAGMSGGWAYVLDLDECAGQRRSSSTSRRCPASDARRLRGIVAAHAAHTGSAVAAALLADWPAARGAVPCGRAARLQAGARGHRARTRRAGEDVDAAVMAAARR